MQTSSNKFCDQCGFTNTQTARFCRGCGTPLGTSSTNYLPQGQPTGILRNTTLTGTLHNGQYRIVRQLGQGGMGTVYLAKDLSLGERQVAIKEMSQDNLPPEEIADAVDAFKREAIMLGSLRHSHLPHIYAHFEDRGRWYLVMDFIAGETLEAMMTKFPGGHLPVDLVLSIGLQLCTVLHYLHTQTPSIIFRDLKPANVMYENETIYLIDFGIARLFKTGQQQDTTALGSQGYAAPEQYGRSQTTTRSDIYSLGATLHHLLSGIDSSEHPFRFPSLIQVGGDPLLRDLDTLIQRMVAIDQTKRPDSALTVKQELQRIESIPTRSMSNTLSIQSTALPLQGPGSSIISGSLLSEDLALPLIQVYCVYAKRNKKVLEELKKQLKIVSRRKFHVRIVDEIAAGARREHAIEGILQQSHLTLLLVSTDFLANDECTTNAEKAVLFTRQGLGMVIPIILDKCEWQEEPYGNLEFLPPGKPLSLWGQKDQAWGKIGTDLRSKFETLQKQGNLSVLSIPSASTVPISQVPSL